jgi:hypothetical protein
MKQRVFLSLGIILAALIGMAALAQAHVPAASGEKEAGQAGAHSLGGSGVLHIAGASFVPESSSTVYSTSGEGDVSVTGASDRYMHAPVLLPDGALVSGLTFYYYDNHATGLVSAGLIRNNDPDIGSRSILANAASPGGIRGYDNAYGSTGPSPVEIDNARYNYEVEVNWSDGSSDLKLMSVKLFYTNP